MYIFTASEQVNKRHPDHVGEVGEDWRHDSEGIGKAPSFNEKTATFFAIKRFLEKSSRYISQAYEAHLIVPMPSFVCFFLFLKRK